MKSTKDREKDRDREAGETIEKRRPLSQTQQQKKKRISFSQFHSQYSFKTSLI